MPTKYLRLFGYCLLGCGVALAFVSVNSLYVMAWKGARVRDVLAPHLASVPASHNAGEPIFTIQISADDAFKLWYFNFPYKDRPDPENARIRAFGSIILMGIGFGLVTHSTRKPRKKEIAEQAGTGQPATRLVSKSEGGDKPQPEAEGRSR